MNTQTKNLSISAIIMTLCLVSLALLLNALFTPPLPPYIEPVGEIEIVGDYPYTTGLDGGVGKMFFNWEERDFIIDRDFVCYNSDYDFSATIISAGNIQEYFDPDQSRLETYLDRDHTQPAGTVPKGTVVHARIIQHFTAGTSYEMPSYDYVLNWRNTQ